MARKRVGNNAFEIIDFGRRLACRAAHASTEKRRRLVRFHEKAWRRKLPQDGSCPNIIPELQLESPSNVLLPMLLKTKAAPMPMHPLAAEALRAFVFEAGRVLLPKAVSRDTTEDCAISSSVQPLVALIRDRESELASCRFESFEKASTCEAPTCDFAPAWAPVLVSLLLVTLGFALGRATASPRTARVARTVGPGEAAIVEEELRPSHGSLAAARARAREIRG